MNLSIVHVGLTVCLCFFLLLPLGAIMRERPASPAAPSKTCIERGAAAHGRELGELAAPRPSASSRVDSLPSALRGRVFPASTKTRCETEANCVSIFDDVLGVEMPAEATAWQERILARRTFRCQARAKRSGRGVYMECRIDTNAWSAAEHDAALGPLLDALRDRHGAERSLKADRLSGALKETWDWGSGGGTPQGAPRRTLRITSRWRYNPRGLGVPNVIKLAWQDVGR